MAVWLKIVTIAIRAAQLICAVVIVGVAGQYIADPVAERKGDLGHLSRFIFTIVFGTLSAFLAAIWLIPFSSNHMNWKFDAILALPLAAGGGWLAYCSIDTCGNPAFSDSSDAVKNINVSDDDDQLLKPGSSVCTKWRVLYVFSFAAAVLWMISAAVGFFWVKKHFVKPKPKAGRRR
ncbi:integral membrane protein [Dactylonectria macrodidyma]|uniref:Integral membrane protein n=1 Tax=Dactylonectria macrodidyma TaxID=307937 RepID=A0A9P9DJ03_9HYPO|nr:integral membrane protein [Dactylonectria macrodidyma]